MLRRNVVPLLSVLCALCFLCTSAAAAQTAPARAPLRYRVIGVYDSRSGDAVDGAEIADLTTGITALTTKTGTIGLLLADTNGTIIRIRKVGYVPALVSVATAQRDTIPLTLTLDPVPTLPTVVTHAHSSRDAADTVLQLERNGFYDRKLTSGAPSSSFLTEKQIGRLTLVSDAAALSGRAICPTNLYLNGVRVSDVTAGKNMGRGRVAISLRKELVDQLVSPGEVLAMEFYRTADAPPEYNATRKPDAPDCGVTLIWTK